MVEPIIMRSWHMTTAPDIGPGISPSENNAIIELDEYENIRSIGKNVAIVVAHQPAAGYIPPTVEMEETDLFGSGTITPVIRAQGSLKEGHSYAVTFGVDTIATIGGYEYGFQYVTDEVMVYDETVQVLSCLYRKILPNTLVPI